MTTANNAAAARVVFLFDVDNTLLDNDRVTADLRRHLEREVGPQRAQQYWTFFEQLRTELGYADYLGALQRYRHEFPHDPLKQWGPAVILSDGDVVFQPRKVDRAGLFEAVDGRVLIYVHKEMELDDVAQRYPAEHYVLVDDKLRILSAVKKIWGARVSTIFVRQGHYAYDPKIVTAYPPADVSLGRIGELIDCDLAKLLKV